MFSARNGLLTVALLWALAPYVSDLPVYDDSTLYLSVLAVFLVLTLLPSWSSDSRGILILGNDRLAGELRRELEGNSDRRTRKGTTLLPQAGIDAAGSPDMNAERLREIILRNGISDVIITDEGFGSREDLTSLLIECKLEGVRVQQARDFYEDVSKKVWLDAVQPQSFIYSDIFTPPPYYLAAKRVLDLVCAVGVLVLTLPLMLLIALAVKLESKGPVLYRQERIGQFGVPFTLYKFRSMAANAEEETGPIWATENDDRATRVGRILRRSHLDELPQVINVLKNELAFVGPRPERECFVIPLSKEIPFFRLREYIKPGITGWAQVSFPYGDSVDAAYEKLQYDLYFAKHASLGFDLFVLWKTVKQVVLRRGR
jgi:exopolysaccharide biosynthesis polyprenyl glycosylphosphotransferase